MNDPTPTPSDDNAPRRGDIERGAVDVTVSIGSVTLPNPVMTASGTAGYGSEFEPYFDLAAIGAVVTKSIAAFAWEGNPPPRVRPTPMGMLNAVGLQGPGVSAWLTDYLPALASTGARVVCSIWGRTVDEYAAAAQLLAAAPESVVAVEVNLSCPNLAGHGIFAHDPSLSAAVIAAAAACERPLWAKLSANTDRTVEVAGAVHDAGAEAVTLINTLTGLAIDQRTLAAGLGNGGGGLSGPAIHPVAVRTVYDVRRAYPKLPIVGVGGIASGWDAIEMMLAGADAVQVGTATFADPAAPQRIADELIDWMVERQIPHLGDLPRLA